MQKFGKIYGAGGRIPGMRWIVAAAPPIGLYKIAIGVRILRIFIEVLHIRVGRRAIEVEVIFFDVLAVIAFRVGQPEQPLFQDRILAIPKRQGEAQPLVVVAYPGERPRPSDRRASGPDRA
jgi:hypothetical protein